MTKVSVAVVLLGLLVLPSTGGLADTGPETGPFFVQDHFTLTFGETGNPYAAGGSLHSIGLVKDWVINTNVAWFQIDAANSRSAALIDAQHVTVYDVATMTIYAGALGNTATTLWTGTGTMTTMAKADGSRYAAPVRPTYETQPVTFQGSGYGGFAATSTSSTFSDPLFRINWLGSYNWGYDNAVGGSFGPNSTYQNGNLQMAVDLVRQGVLAESVYDFGAGNPSVVADGHDPEPYLTWTGPHNDRNIPVDTLDRLHLGINWSGDTHTPNPNSTSDPDNHLQWYARYGGEVIAPVSGLYHVAVDADDWVKLAIDGTDVAGHLLGPLPWQGSYEPGLVNNPTADIWLSAGTHQLSIKYFEGYGWSTIDGSDGGAGFTVDVTLVPEPSSVLAVVTGLASLAAALRRRSRD